MKTKIIDLALAELNMKWMALSVYYEGDDEKAISMLQNDLERLAKLVGSSPKLDSNYSNTWGYKVFGMYASYEEMQEVADIIESGF